MLTVFYYASAGQVATFDFIDVERIEVLRALRERCSARTRPRERLTLLTRPASPPGCRCWFSYGNYGSVKAKTSVTGPLSKPFTDCSSLVAHNAMVPMENIRTGKHLAEIITRLRARLC